MIVAFTGTQSGMTKWQKAECLERLKELKPTEFITGMCIGADYESTLLAIEAGVRIFTFYPGSLPLKRKSLFEFSSKLCDSTWRDKEILGETLNYRYYPIKPALERNQDLVNSSSAIICAPKEHTNTLRSGTWATIRYAWKKQRKNKFYRVIIIPPIDREEIEDAERNESTDGRDPESN